MLGERRIGAAFCALSIAVVVHGCSAEGPGNRSAGLGTCMPGETQMCLCAGKPSQVQTCQPDGTFSSCPCGAQAGGQGGAMAGAAPGGAGGQGPRAGMSAQATSGSGGRAGAAGAAAGAAGAGQSGQGGARAGAGAGGAGGAMAAAGSGGAPAGTGEFEQERQACVDYINMYRMTRGLMPLMRGTPAQEACSDMGAKQDGDSGVAHGSAGSCQGLGGQNTCPGYPLRGTLEATLKGCLDQMWGEGEPAEGVQACIADRAGCFQMHGHWINMTMTSYGRVACGFYKMANGRYWMNQNFGR